MSTLLRSVPGRPSTLTSWRTLALATSFLLPFAVHATHLLNYFYERGTRLCDTGLFAAVLWRPTWGQRLPQSVVDPQAGSTMCALNLSDTYLSTHFSPWFWLLGAPSHLLPLGSTAWFVLVQALLMALIGVTGFVAVRRTAVESGALDGPRGWMLGQLFAFNGIVLASITFPHFELLIPCAVLAVFLVLPREGLRVTLPLLVLAQLLREDVGLHAALLALALGLARLLDGGDWRAQRDPLILAAAGIGLSLCAMLAQRLLFGGGGSLGKIYIGDPPWGHLDAALVAERLLFLVRERAYVVVLFPIVLLHARWRRSWVPLAALASCMPWLVLHVLAVKREPAMLYMYYAFPVMAAYLWPLVGEAYIDDGRGGQGGRRARAWKAAVIATAGMLALSALATPFYTLRNFVVSSLPQSGARHAADTERFLDAVLDDGEALGTVVLDAYAAALRPTRIPLARVWDETHALDGDSVVFHERMPRRDALRGALERAGMRHCHALPGTPFRLATRLEAPATLVQAFGLRESSLARCDGTATGDD